MLRRRSDKKSSNTSGFTLVEVLVVIAIILLLVALVMPVMRSVRLTAIRVVCSSNLQQLYLGFTHYAAEQRGFLPCSYPIAPGMRDWVGGGLGKPVDNGTIWDYVREAQVYMCPADSMWRYWPKAPTHSFSMPKPRDCNHLGNVGGDKCLLVDESERTINDGRFVNAWDTFASRHTISGWGQNERGNAGGNILFVDGHVEFFSVQQIVGANQPMFQ